jgi:hypothetical protein
MIISGHNRLHPTGLMLARADIMKKARPRLHNIAAGMTRPKTLPKNIISKKPMPIEINMIGHRNDQVNGKYDVTRKINPRPVKIEPGMNIPQYLPRFEEAMNRNQMPPTKKMAGNIKFVICIQLGRKFSTRNNSPSVISIAAMISKAACPFLISTPFKYGPSSYYQKTHS